MTGPNPWVDRFVKPGRVILRKIAKEVGWCRAQRGPPRSIWWASLHSTPPYFSNIPHFEEPIDPGPNPIRRAKRPILLALRSAETRGPTAREIAVRREAAMLRRSAILALLLGTWPCRAGIAAEDHFFRHDNVMGTSMELSVRADDASAARRAEDRALWEIDRLAAIFSNHDPASEFRRWQAAPARPFEGLGRAVPVARGERRLARAERRGLRPEGAGPGAALVRRRPA